MFNFVELYRINVFEYESDGWWKIIHMYEYIYELLIMY